jgi:hypothetical protein
VPVVVLPDPLVVLEALTVSGNETVRAVPVLPAPVRTIVWAPAGVPAGTAN